MVRLVAVKFLDQAVDQDRSQGRGRPGQALQSFRRLEVAENPDRQQTAFRMTKCFVLWFTFPFLLFIILVI